MGSGATQSIANGASDLRRSGLSPAGTSSWPTCPGVHVERRGDGGGAVAEVLERQPHYRFSRQRGVPSVTWRTVSAPGGTGRGTVGLCPLSWPALVGCGGSRRVAGSRQPAPTVPSHDLGFVELLAQRTATAAGRQPPPCRDKYADERIRLMRALHAAGPEVRDDFLVPGSSTRTGTGTWSGTEDVVMPHRRHRHRQHPSGPGTQTERVWPPLQFAEDDDALFVRIVAAAGR